MKTLQPASLEELAAAVRAEESVVIIGAGTKPRLTAAGAQRTRISTTRLTGITDYTASEFTFTALAGTPVRDIAAALAREGQYLPFDPPLVDAGATIGGTVAAGLSGPGRFRFGGVRDFILGVRFVDGEGRLLRMGGKVVKNAAGFDLAKFFVGSAGRFGAIGEVSFKVFPRPAARLTLRLVVAGSDELTQLLAEAGRARWEVDALDAAPAEGCAFLRLAGPAAALEGLATEILARYRGEALAAEQADAFWCDAVNFGWAAGARVLAKVALPPAKGTALTTAMGRFAGVTMRLSAGGNVAWVAVSDPTQGPAIDAALTGLGLAGMTLRGEAPLWLGVRKRAEFMTAVRRALDPHGRFPGLDD